MQEKIIILDFGSQTTQLIGRRLRELNVYCEIVPYNKFPYGDESVKGVILSGSPFSVYDKSAFKVDLSGIRGKYPILGICYGAQFISYSNGGRVEPAGTREYGRAHLGSFDSENVLFKWAREISLVWMSHGDTITAIPDNFKTIASTDKVAIAAYQVTGEKMWGVQFHPEVTHSDEGRAVIENFLNICGCVGDWSMETYAQTAIANIREIVGDKGTVLLGLSGGVDSSVAAALIYKAIGDRLTCVYVDHGFMRKGETEQVVNVFTHTFPVRLVASDASKIFYEDLKGVSDPETKRKIIGRDFLKVFKAESEKLGKLDYFAQGTIYPDVIESGQATGAAVIKSHHNVGGLPKELGFTQLIEPLRMLFKDEVRALGETLGLPHDLVWRQPFPGPGLAIRVIGDLTPEKVEIVRESDAVLREEIAKAGLDADIHQYFTVLTGIRSVGVMGDERTYDYTVAIRAVTTDDFMTADWARIPYDVVRTISARIVNEVPHVNRVVLDVTTKPPASIEWE